MCKLTIIYYDKNTILTPKDFGSLDCQTFYQNDAKKLYIEGIVTVKKQAIHDFHFDGTTLKGIYPDGKMYQTFSIYNNGQGLSTIGPVAMNVPYASQIVFEKQKNSKTCSTAIPY